MKLIIDIPEDLYAHIYSDAEIIIYGGMRSGKTLLATLLRSIRNGTPLDDVKAIMEKQIERDFAFAETETFKVPCHYGTANGLQVAVRILDNIGKAESEE